LVEMHGGKIEAFSEGVGQGSEFVVRLPVVAEMVVQQPAKVQAEEIRQPLPLHLLLVEDNQDTAVTLAALLKRCGHEVDIAHTGPEALEKTAKSKPDLVLLDIGLPGMDGYQVAERLKNQDGTSQIPLVAMTGYGSDADRQRCEELGFVRHMVKPIKLQELQAMFCEME
jgi:two-component system, chemotaxis family, CheB/CheR fusion protein